MNPTTIARDQLRAVVERIERLEEETKALNADKSDIYKEAKFNGFDVKALKEVVRQRRREPAEREEFESLVDIYKHALGMLPGEADEAPEALTHARVETIEEFDPETGEVEADKPTTPTPAAVVVAASAPDVAPARPATEAYPEMPSYLRRTA